MGILGKNSSIAGLTFTLSLVILGITVSPVFLGLAVVAIGLLAIRCSKGLGISGIGLGIAIVLIWCGASLGERAALRDNASSHTVSANAEA